MHAVQRQKGTSMNWQWDTAAVMPSASLQSPDMTVHTPQHFKPLHPNPAQCPHLLGSLRSSMGSAKLGLTLTLLLRGHWAGVPALLTGRM
jgi:hypothetical protein